MFTNLYVDATAKIQNLINQTPRDGAWHEIDGYSVSIDGNCAAIYEPGSPLHGECDHYVRLDG